MIRSLNLDQEFIPSSLPEIEFTMKQFGGGEWNIVLNNRIDYSKVEKVLITHRCNNSESLMQILLAADALKIKGVSEIELFIPYLPYARQDRLCSEGESFSLKVFCNLINSVRLKKVFVLDCHSDVGVALLNNCVNLSNLQYVNQVVSNTGVNVLISPDAGSNKKLNKIAEALDCKLIKCDKSRDLATGKLTKFEVFGNIGGEDVLIVDDICSYGGTFRGLAAELKKAGASNIYLFVTHYEGVVSVDSLKEAGITDVFSTSSISGIHRATQLNISI